MTDIRPCRDCKDWNLCSLTESEKEWFGYQHVRFCIHHIFWLLKYEEIIRGKAWPIPDELAPGGMRPQILSEAAFVKISVVLAELSYRLSRCGDKGDLLSEECKRREKVQYLSDKAKSALYYVAGDNRKKTSFRVWQGMKRYRNDNMRQNLRDLTNIKT